MNNEKGIATWVVILIIALIVVGAIYFSYYAKPMATVMMGGAEQAKPAIQRAERAKETMDKVTHATEDVTKKANEDVEK
jgi:F0F1-type ATP synthase membrane subunit b/b'